MLVSRALLASNSSANVLFAQALAPWFSPKMWGGGGYLKVHKEVGSMIDWYNVQFYNRACSLDWVDMTGS